MHTEQYNLQKGWYYIGDQTWTVVDLWPVWPTLGEQVSQSTTFFLDGF